MSARSHRNRYREDPYGRDFAEVLKRAKRFYEDGTFFIYKSKDLYFAHRPSLPPFKDPEGAIYYYRPMTKGARWERRD